MNTTKQKNTGNRFKIVATLLFIGFAAGSFSFLHGQVRPGMQVFDISNAFTNGQSFFLSNICDEIEYVCLETRSGLTIGKPDIIDVGEKYIAIADTKILQAWLFNRQGRFIRKLGNSGKLPGEYSTLRNLSLSWNEQWAAVFDPKEGKVILFATETGEFKEIKISKGPGEVVFGPANLLLASWTYRLSALNGNCQFSWIDISNGNPVPFGPVPDKVRSWGSISIPVHRQQNELIVDQLYNDTSYFIRTRGSMEPIVSFTVGVNRFPADSYGDHTAYQKNIGNCKRTGPWVQCGPWIFMDGYNGLENRHIVYNVNEKTATSLIRFDDLRDRVFDNNVDGGPAFWFEGITSAGDIFQVITAEKMLRLKDAGYLFKYRSTNPVAMDRFRKVLAGITPTNNPVIQVLKSKQEK